MGVFRDAWFMDLSTKRMINMVVNSSHGDVSLCQLPAELKC